MSGIVYSQSSQKEVGPIFSKVAPSALIPNSNMRAKIVNKTNEEKTTISNGVVSVVLPRGVTSKTIETISEINKAENINVEIQNQATTSTSTTTDINVVKEVPKTNKQIKKEKEEQEKIEKEQQENVANAAESLNNGMSAYMKLMKKIQDEKAKFDAAKAKALGILALVSMGVAFVKKKAKKPKISDSVKKQKKLLKEKITAGIKMPKPPTIPKVEIPIPQNPLPGLISTAKSTLSTQSLFEVPKTGVK